MKAAKILGTTIPQEQPVRRSSESLDLDISDVALAPGEGPPPIPLRSSSGATTLSGIDAISANRMATIESQMSVDPPLHHRSTKQHEISPFLFQGNDQEDAKGSIGSASGRQYDHSNNASRSILTDNSGSGSSRFFASQTTLPLRPSTPPLSASASQVSLGGFATPGTAGKRSKSSKNPLKFFSKNAKKSSSNLREEELSPNTTPRIHQSGASGSHARPETRGDGSAMGIDEELGFDDHETFRESRRTKLMGRPRTRDKEVKRTRTAGSTMDGDLGLGVTIAQPHRGTYHPGFNRRSHRDDVPLALDTNFDHIDDFVDTSLRQPSLVGPKGETLASEDVVPRKMNASPSPVSATRPPLRDRSTSVSFVEQKRPSSASVDSPQRPGNLRRMATASGAPVVPQKSPLQPQRIDVTSSNLVKMNKSQMEAILQARGGGNTPTSTSSESVDEPSLRQQQQQDRINGFISADQPYKSLINASDLTPGVSHRDDRKASYTSTASRMTNGSDISPTTSVNNLNKTSSKFMPERRPSQQGVDAGYKFPPHNRTGADPRKSSASSGKVTSSWMAPDSWAVQPQKLRDVLRDDEDGVEDDALSPGVDPLSASPSYKRDASRPSLASSIWSGLGSSSLGGNQSSISSADAALGRDGLASTEGLQGRRETIDSSQSYTSVPTDQDGITTRKSSDSSFEVLQALPTQLQSTAAGSPAAVRPGSRGGSTIGQAAAAAAAAAGRLGLHRPSRIKLSSSRPNTGNSINHPFGTPTPGKGIPVTPSADEDNQFNWKSSKRTSANQTASKHTFMRVYKDDGMYSVVSISLDATASELRTILARKSIDPAQVNRLFVRDKGSERPLGQSEKPAILQRRRLEQAGYTEADSLEELGREDLSFLIKFVFRPDRVTNFDSYSFGNTEADFNVLDLRNRNLEMVPIFLYKNAEWIKSLDLSGNPMHDIPNDFIQICTNLTTLSLSHLSLKRVPQSIRQAVHLTHLDLSDNRIRELNHINLSEIPQLMSLKAQNNRLSELPGYFAWMKNLRDLNVSNNQFAIFPSVACELENLTLLDISFNTIVELPNELNMLKRLQRFVFVGNNVEQLPSSIGEMHNLRVIDLRRNLLQDISVLFNLPSLEILRCEHNSLKRMDVTFGERLKTLQIGQNPLSKATFNAKAMCALTILDLSSANMGKLDDDVLSQLPNLTELVLDRNSLIVLPDNLGALTQLTKLSCTNNLLATLPDSLGLLTNLVELQAHNNNLKSLPASIWHCSSLRRLNVSSNLLESFPSTSDAAASLAPGSSVDLMVSSAILSQSRKGSAGSLGTLPANGTHSAGRTPLPLSACLTKLRMGDNHLTEDIFAVLHDLPELQILNLSSNDLYEIPSYGLSNLIKLRELYLSGNSIGSIPADDLTLLKELRILHINGNKLQTLPAELGKMMKLVNLDVGTNALKYNISNQQYDWNWNSNPNLRYLNLSGNKRLEIKSNTVMTGFDGAHSNGTPAYRRTDSSDFQRLTNLRLLGLMDVTVTLHQMPDEFDDRRVRTSLSQINQMAYGISDALGQHDHLSIVDVVVPNFRKRDDECMFGMFAGRGHGDKMGSRIAFHLAQWVNFRIQWEVQRLQTPGQQAPPDMDKVQDIIRRAFLRMEKEYADVLISEGVRVRQDFRTQSNGKEAGKTEAPMTTDSISSGNWRSGASAVLAYVIKKTLFVANCGDALAVLSRNSTAHLVSTKHVPFDRDETLRIRSCEGWVSLHGQVNDTLEVSRSFGHYHLAPIVNAAPAVHKIELTDSDEFIILANKTLWDFIPYQTAVDIARMDRDDPMMAAQKLRDYAISYGAEDSIMVMVVAVGDLFEKTRGGMRGGAQTQGLTPAVATGQSYNDGGSIFEPHWEGFKKPTMRRGREFLPGDRTLARLQREVPPPVGQVALVFTDIRNSTHLWETNAGMQTAMRMHNFLLRRQLRNIGGYEVKTEGDAFMVSFQSVTSALLWCFQVQLQLLTENWPQEILESEDGKEIYSERTGELMYRGLSVRMGIHWGRPVCEADPITRRMDYFGPMVNRASRIQSAAEGGQILVSRDVLAELRTWFGSAGDVQRRSELAEDEGDMTDLTKAFEDGTYLLHDPNVSRDVVLLRRLGYSFFDVGEHRLKGLETPEHLISVYPKGLLSRCSNQIESGTARPTSILRTTAALEEIVDADGAEAPSGALVSKASDTVEATSVPLVQATLAPVEVFEPIGHLLSVDEVKMVCYICLRLEALAQGQVYAGIQESIEASMAATEPTNSSRPLSYTHESDERQSMLKRQSVSLGMIDATRHSSADLSHLTSTLGNVQAQPLLALSTPRQRVVEDHLHHHPELMLSGLRDDATDDELCVVLNAFIGRIWMALSNLGLRKMLSQHSSTSGIDLRADITQIFDLLQSTNVLGSA